MEVTMNRFVALMFVPLFLVAGPDHSNYWNAEEYRNNSSEQQDSAAELIKTIPFEKDQSVLDIGCGDGKITNAIAEMVSSGHVLGLDVSPFMIDSAKKTFHKNNLSFITLNAVDIDYVQEFDVVTSFSTLQWVSDQKTVLAGVMKALRPGGKIFFQMPCEMPPEMQAALKETMNKEEWSPYFEGFDSGLYFFSEEEYAEYLRETGFNEELVQARIRTHKFKDRNAFVKFLVQWFPYLEPLPIGKRMYFLNDVLNSYFKAVPRGENGEAFFPVKRLTVVASKPL